MECCEPAALTSATEPAAARHARMAAVHAPEGVATAMGGTGDVVERLRRRGLSSVPDTVSVMPPCGGSDKRRSTGDMSAGCACHSPDLGASPRPLRHRPPRRLAGPCSTLPRHTVSQDRPGASRQTAEFKGLAHGLSLEAALRPISRVLRAMRRRTRVSVCCAPGELRNSTPLASLLRQYAAITFIRRWLASACLRMWSAAT